MKSIFNFQCFCLMYLALQFGCTARNSVSIKGDSGSTVEIKNGALASGNSLKHTLALVSVLQTLPNAEVKVGAFCSGSLLRIGENSFDVLTATHCIEFGKPLADFRTQLSEPVEFKSLYSPLKYAFPEIGSFGISKNKGVYSKSGKLDVAVIRFTGKPPRSHSPVALATATSRESFSAVLAGYGITSYTFVNDAGILREALAKVRFQKEKGTIQVTDALSGACRIDSGGPLFLPQNGFIQFGVLSKGIEYEGECHGNNTYNDVRLFLEWKEATGRSEFREWKSF
jgi:secreted trypsin-like serine protease